MTASRRIYKKILKWFSVFFISFTMTLSIYFSSKNIKGEDRQGLRDEEVLIEEVYSEEKSREEFLEEVGSEDFEPVVEIVRDSTTREDVQVSSYEPGEIKTDSSQSYETASFCESMYRVTSEGSVRELTINSSGANNVKLIDLSDYANGVFAFKWRGGSFEYGLANQKSIPALREVEISDEVETSPRTRISDLIPFDGNKYIFFKQLETVAELTIHLIYPQVSGGGGFQGGAYHSSGAKYSSLGIIPREVWSSDLDINNPSRLVWDPVYYKVEKIVIHHTATPNNEDPIYWMKAIYTYHSLTLGLGDIGYNYLIDQYGNIYEGKLGGDEAKGYHAGSSGNPNSIGISVIGTYTSVAPSAEALDALVRLMSEKAAFYNFDLGWHSTVYGHRDFMATACPGNAFYAQLPDITAYADSYKDSYFTTLKSVVSEVNEEIDNRDYKPGKLALFFANAAEISIPAWSGVDNYNTLDNIATLSMTGSSSPYENVSDRLRTLYKVFWLGGNVESASLIYRGYLQDF